MRWRSGVIDSSIAGRSARERAAASSCNLRCQNIREWWCDQFRSNGPSRLRLSRQPTPAERVSPITFIICFVSATIGSSESLSRASRPSLKSLTIGGLKPAWPNSSATPKPIDRRPLTWSRSTTSSRRLCDKVIRSVARAIDGAAPNRPAKLFGRKLSPSAANADTAIPPQGTVGHIRALLLPVEPSDS